MNDSSSVFYPIKMLQTIWSKIKKSWKIGFFSTFIMGILIHAYALTNNFLTLDSMWNLYSPQDMLSSGRPFLTYVCAISSDFTLPWINGILALLFLSATVVVLIEIFQLDNPILIGLFSGFVAAFPSVTEGFIYNYTIDGYMIALLLSVVAFLWTDRRNKGFLGGGLLLGFSIGIYQGYLSVTIILCILQLLLLLLKDIKPKDFFVKVAHYAGLGVIGYSFYFIALKVMLILKNVELSGYQGTDQVFSLTDLPGGIVEAYRNFITFGIYGNIFGYNLFTMIGTILIFLGIILVFLIQLVAIKQGRLWKISMAILLALLLPLGANIIHLFSKGTLYRLVMRFPWVLFFLFAMILLERYSMKNGKAPIVLKSFHQWTTLLGIFILILNFSVLANIDYFNMNERYEKTYGFSLRLIDRIEQTEGYTTGVKVSILGGIPSVSYYPSYNLTNDILKGHYASDGDYCVNSTEKFATFFSHYMNFTINTIPYSEELKLVETKEYKEMKTYPDKDSLQYIGDVLVIKLN